MYPKIDWSGVTFNPGMTHRPAADSAIVAGMKAKSKMEQQSTSSATRNTGVSKAQRHLTEVLRSLLVPRSAMATLPEGNTQRGNKIATVEILVNYMHPKLHYPGKFQKLLSFDDSVRELTLLVVVSFVRCVVDGADSQRVMELDIFVPSLSLAVEYQGEHHYHADKHFYFRVSD